MSDTIAFLLRNAADAYLDALGDNATDDSAFLILDKRARQRGLRIRAEQRGVSGTIITLERIED